MTVEGDNPVDTGTAQPTAAPKSAAEIFAELEADPSQAKLEDEKDDQAADPQGEPEAEDEPEAEEAEGEDSEAPENEDDAETEATDPPASIEIDGKAIPLTEVKDGYLRQQDYTRKTQALADEKREFSQAVERVTSVDREARQNLQLADAVVNAVLPPAPDPSLIHTDPISYMQQKEAREQALKVVNELRTRQKSSVDREQALSADDLRRHRDEEMKALTQKAPDFAKDDFRKSFRDEAIKHASFYGYTPEEIDSITDHRQLLVLRDAVAKRQAMLDAKSKVALANKAPKIVAKPGNREAPKSRSIEAQLKNLGRPARPSDIYLLMEKGS